jgi:hypothetical protein
MSLRAALLAAAAAGAAASATGPTVFAAISDWGGTGSFPFTTASQLAVAEAMSTVGTDNDFAFVLSAGNNFMPAGLPGARALTCVGACGRAGVRAASALGCVQRATRACVCLLAAFPSHFGGGPRARRRARRRRRRRFTAPRRARRRSAPPPAAARHSPPPHTRPHAPTFARVAPPPPRRPSTSPPFRVSPPLSAAGSASSAATQARVAATWTDVYTGASLQVPWYAVGGYMDWEGNCTAERALTTSASSRWQYPSLWHSFNVLVPPNYATLQIIMARARGDATR